jgi:beta-phosphoglucomutase
MKPNIIKFNLDRMREDSNTHSKKAVIFDLDGVIVHTDYYHYLAWKAIADRLQLKFNENLNNKLRGVSRLESLNIILDCNKVILSETEKDKIAEEKNEIYKQYLMKLTPADIDSKVLKTLQQLKEKGIKIAIGSSSKNARLILERTGLAHIFDAISDGNNIIHSKPNPEVFIKAAEFISEIPEDCIVVEDAIAGIDAGIAGGFETAALGAATSYEKATYKLSEFSDLLHILELTC